MGVACLLAACSAHAVDLTATAPPTLSSEPAGHEVAMVIRVIDGDTVEVEVLAVHPGFGAGRTRPGRRYDVRLLGIDTPESVRPGSPVECFGREATAAAAALLEGRRVRLVKDVEEVDGYGRLLRYVYLGAEMANARLVVNGYATAYTHPPNVRHAELFASLQRRARRARAGLWSGETCGGP